MILKQFLYKYFHFFGIIFPLNFTLIIHTQFLKRPNFTSYFVIIYKFYVIEGTFCGLLVYLQKISYILEVIIDSIYRN